MLQNGICGVKTGYKSGGDFLVKVRRAVGQWDVLLPLPYDPDRGFVAEA